MDHVTCLSVLVGKAFKLFAKLKFHANDSDIPYFGQIAGESVLRNIARELN